MENISLRLRGGERDVDTKSQKIPTNLLELDIGARPLAPFWITRIRRIALLAGIVQVFRVGFVVTLWAQHFIALVSSREATCTHMQFAEYVT